MREEGEYDHPLQFELRFTRSWVGIVAVRSPVGLRSAASDAERVRGQWESRCRNICGAGVERPQEEMGLGSERNNTLVSRFFVFSSTITNGYQATVTVTYMHRGDTATRWNSRC